MLKKTIAPALIATVMLFTLEPSPACAQTLVQLKDAESAHTLSSSGNSRTSGTSQAELKAAFAKELSRVRTPTLTTADYERLEMKRERQASQQKTQTGFSKRDKIALAVFIIATTALVTALLIHGVDTSTPTCLDEPNNPSCI